MLDGDDNDRSDSWKGIGINAGTLVAIASLFGVAFVAGLSVPAWVDQRIDDGVSAALAPYKLRIEELEDRVSELEAERATTHNDMEDDDDG